MGQLSTRTTGPILTHANCYFRLILSGHSRYIQDAITSLQYKGARVIVSSQTPDDPYEIFTYPIYVLYAADLAHSNNLPYIDHFHLLLETYYALGEDATNALFPLDQHVHTSPEG